MRLQFTEQTLLDSQAWPTDQGRLCSSRIPSAEVQHLENQVTHLAKKASIHCSQTLPSALLLSYLSGTGKPPGLGWGPSPYRTQFLVPCPATASLSLHRPLTELRSLPSLGVSLFVVHVLQAGGHCTDLKHSDFAGAVPYRAEVMSSLVLSFASVHVTMFTFPQLPSAPLLPHHAGTSGSVQGLEADTVHC